MLPLLDTSFAVPRALLDDPDLLLPFISDQDT
jgi:hypothetical protein